MKNYVLGSNAINLNKFGLYTIGGEGKLSIILKIDDTPEGNIGYLIKTNYDDTIGRLSTTWNTDFTVQLSYEDLEEKEKEILQSILRTEIEPKIDSHVFNNILKIIGLIIEETNINVIGKIIEIEGVLIFNIKDVKMIRYMYKSLVIVFLDGLEEKLYINEESQNIIKEEFIKNSKNYI